MSSILKVSVLAASLAASLAAALPAAAVAQSYTAPAGIPIQTAPGAVADRGAGRTVAPSAYDAVVTGSVGRVQPHKPARR